MYCILLFSIKIYSPKAIIYRKKCSIFDRCLMAIALCRRLEPLSRPGWGGVLWVCDGGEGGGEVCGCVSRIYTHIWHLNTEGDKVACRWSKDGQAENSLVDC